MLKNEDSKDLGEKKKLHGLARKLNIDLPVLLKATGFGEKGYETILYPVLKKILSENNDSDSGKLKRIFKFLGTLMELQPRDGFEGLLISQMIFTFENAINCLSNVELTKGDIDIFQKFQNQSMKLMRLYCQQLEALDKHRNKGKQKISVEHVHVHKGGQAIVGSVTQGRG